jgi:hypothetical protein
MPNDKNSNQKKGSAVLDPSQASQKLDRLEREADKSRTKKPGSQANGSDRHNSGRGGGK